MIVNYYASPKTRAPFCGLSCCGNNFGRCERSCYRHKSGITNHMTRMRRYAKRAERILIRREINEYFTELELDFWETIAEHQREMIADQMAYEIECAVTEYQRQLIESLRRGDDNYSHYGSEDI